MSLFFSILLASASTAQSQAPYVDTTDTDRARQYEKVRRDPGVLRILRQLRLGGIRLKPFDAVNTGNLDNGYAWHIDDGFLYLFPYRSIRESRLAERRFKAESVYGESPANRLYRCRSVIAVTVTKQERANRALRELCGRGTRPGEIKNER